MAKKTKKQMVDLSKVKIGPVQHENVDFLLPILRWQWRHIGHLLPSNSFEQHEALYTRDLHPEREAGVWSQLTYAYLQYRHECPDADDKALFSVLVRAIASVPMEDSETSIDIDKVFEHLNAAPNELHNLDYYTPDGHRKSGPKHLR